MTDTLDLKALSAAATQGEWFAIGTGAVCYEKSHSGGGVFWPPGQHTGSNPREDATYVAALVNAFRAGDLHTTADLQAAVEAARAEERGACLEACDHNGYEFPEGCGDQNYNRGVAACVDAIRVRSEDTP